MRHFLTCVPSCRRHRNSFDLTCVSCYCQRRVVIPIVKVGFIARDVTKESPLKDKTLPGARSVPRCTASSACKSRRVVLVEGVFDYYALEGICPSWRRSAPRCRSRSCSGCSWPASTTSRSCGTAMPPDEMRPNARPNGFNRRCACALPSCRRAKTSTSCRWRRCSTSSGRPVPYGELSHRLQRAGLMEQRTEGRHDDNSL